MIINNNIGALNTHRQLSLNTANQAKNMEKLSSGLKINRGADDAAGLSISEKMRAQIRGLDRAAQNAQDGISMIQTADGAMNEAHAILQRMRELTVQATNDTNATDERDAIKGELEQLSKALTDIKDTTQFNGQKLLVGESGDDVVGAAGVVTIQAGANSGESVAFDFTTTTKAELSSIVTSVKVDLTAGSQVNGDIFDDQTKAAAYMDKLDAAIKDVSAGRSYLGAVQNRLEYTINNLNSASQNTQAAESRIRDVDMAKEVVENSKNGILAQAAQAMLAQANQQPQSVLQLLR